MSYIIIIYKDGTPYCLMEMATSLSILINPKCIQLLITSIDIKFEAGTVLLINKLINWVYIIMCCFKVSVSHLMLRFNTLSGSNTNTEQPNTVQANTERPKVFSDLCVCIDLWMDWFILFQKVEVLVTQSKIQYLSSINNRYYIIILPYLYQLPLDYINV